MAEFNLPHLHLAYPLGITPSKFRRDLWRQQTRISGLSYGSCLRDPTFSRLNGTPTCDGRTDGQTYDDGMCRASTASRG